MELTTDMYIVFSLLGLAIFLFVTDLLRVDIVGILMMVLLPLTGVLPAERAMMNVVAGKIIKIAGKSEHRMMVMISVSVAVISSFMQNIGAAALFMPVTMRICRQQGFSASRILMPMGFCAIIGGCLTLVGSSLWPAGGRVLKLEGWNCLRIRR